MTGVPVLVVAAALLLVAVAAARFTVVLVGHRPAREHARQVRTSALAAVQRRSWAESNHKTLPVQDDRIDRPVLYRAPR